MAEIKAKRVQLCLSRRHYGEATGEIVVDGLEIYPAAAFVELLKDLRKTTHIAAMNAVTDYGGGGDVFTEYHKDIVEIDAILAQLKGAEDGSG